MRTKKILLSWILALSVLLAGCQFSSQTSDSIGRFSKANAAYKAGDYDAALKLYGQITDDGFVSALIYYNIGNCFMKKNDLGHALAWYERALRLTPRDGDLQANLKFAKTMMKNPEVAAPKNFEQRIFVHFSCITDDEIVIILCLLLSVIAMLILLGLYLQWRFKKTFFLLAILTMVFIFHVFAFFAKLGIYNEHAIILSTVEIKYEPEEKATTHFTAYEGWKVRILKENSGWVKIERPDGLSGWLPRDLLERI